MARNRRGRSTSQAQETKATLKEYETKLVHVHKNGKVFRGVVEYNGVEYFYSANKYCMPMVFGAKDLEISKETAKALNNWYAETHKGLKLYDNIEKLFNNPKAVVYLKEISKGILIVKTKSEYMGYMPGPAGSRVVNMQLKDMKPLSCTHNKKQGFAKKVVDDNYKPFRQMASQGQRIKDEMIPEFKRVIAALEEQIKNNKPDPDGPGPNRTKEETKPEPQPEVQVVKETQQTQEQPQRTTRRRRTTVMENNQEQPTVKKSEIVICYCGSCNCDTEQERVNDSEVMCKECGSQWEYFPEETEEETVVETVEEEIVTEETKEEEPQISVEEEMEQTMKHEEKKVEEQVREELEQRNTRRRTRRTVEEIPQVTNEDMHGRESNDESTVVRQDNGAEEMPSNTNDVSNIPTNEKAINNDDYDWSYEDIKCDDINPGEAGDSFEVEDDILW